MNFVKHFSSERKYTYWTHQNCAQGRREETTK